MKVRSPGLGRQLLLRGLGALSRHALVRLGKGLFFAMGTMWLSDFGAQWLSSWGAVGFKLRPISSVFLGLLRTISLKVFLHLF